MRFPRLASAFACTVGILIPAALAQSPAVFEPNRGQAAPEVAFVARTTDGTALLAGATTAFVHGDRVQQMTFIGAQASTCIEALHGLPGKSHYLRSNDPACWVTDVPQFDGVRFVDLYPGVDLVWGSRGGYLEYDLELRFGADLACVALHFEGIDEAHVDGNGDLHVLSGEREVIHRKPICWQTEPDGERRSVECRFLVTDHVVRFEADALDPDLPFTIDPTLVFSTFLGGTLLDIVGGLGVDVAGNVVVSGSTASLDFPISGGFQASFAGVRDVFVSKLSADGTTLLWSTFLGGTGHDYLEPSGLAIDAAGRPCLAGSTLSSDFPTTPGCAQGSNGGSSGVSDVFAAVLAADGSALVYSTYLGGPNSDGSRAIAVDAQGRLAITGSARAGFPTTPGAYSRTIAGDADIFATLIAPQGGGAADIVYSTYLGGGLFDRGDDVAVDALGRIHVCATSATTKTSAKLPTTSSAFRPTLTIANNDTSTKYAGYYAVLLPVGSGLSDLSYASFVNSRQSYVLTAYALALDSLGRAFISGTADGATIPTTANGRDLSANGGHDSYLLVVDPVLSGSASLVYGSYIGSSDTDRGTDVAVGSDGRAYMVGISSSTTVPPGNTKKIPFPTTANALSRVCAGVVDCTVTVLDRSLAPSQQLIYSTLLGGSGTDYPVQIKEWINGRFFVGGYIGPDGSGFPTTPGAYDNTYNGDADGFVLRFDF